MSTYMKTIEEVARKLATKKAFPEFSVDQLKDLEDAVSMALRNAAPYALYRLENCVNGRGRPYAG